MLQHTIKGQRTCEKTKLNNHSANIGITQTDTWKGKYQSTDNTKNGKRKGKLLPKNEISGGKATQHTETYLIYFNDHRCFSKSEESKCM